MLARPTQADALVRPLSRRRWHTHDLDVPRPLASELSQAWILNSRPRSRMAAARPNASAAPREGVVLRLATPHLVATVLSVGLHVLTATPPTIKTPPLALFRQRRQPAQLESTYLLRAYPEEKICLRNVAMRRILAHARHASRDSSASLPLAFASPLCVPIVGNTVEDCNYSARCWCPPLNGPRWPCARASRKRRRAPCPRSWTARRRRHPPVRRPPLPRAPAPAGHPAWLHARPERCVDGRHGLLGSPRVEKQPDDAAIPAASAFWAKARTLDELMTPCWRSGPRAACPGHDGLGIHPSCASNAFMSSSRRPCLGNHLARTRPPRPLFGGWLRRDGNLPRGRQQMRRGCREMFQGSAALGSNHEQRAQGASGLASRLNKNGVFPTTSINLRTPSPWHVQHFDASMRAR